MYIYKNYTIKGILEFSGFHLLWLALWGYNRSVVVRIYTGSRF